MNEEALNTENDLLFEEIQKCCKELSKYFDSVQIFCTKHEFEKVGTSAFIWGEGNFYARFGQIDLWVKEQKLHD